VVVLSESPLQAMPLIAKVGGRPSGNISALYGSKKAVIWDVAKGNLQHNCSTCCFT
jgi:hypothetical protein